MGASCCGHNATFEGLSERYGERTRNPGATRQLDLDSGFAGCARAPE